MAKKYALFYRRHKTDTGTKSELLNVKKHLVKLGHDVGSIRIRKIKK